MPYVIHVTETFKRLYAALDGTEKQWIQKMRVQLEENPLGKPLRYDWFREKKFLNKRLFYLVDEKRKKVLLVSFASKKEQQEIIDFVMKNKAELLSYLGSL